MKRHFIFVTSPGFQAFVSAGPKRPFGRPVEPETGEVPLVCSAVVLAARMEQRLTTARYLEITGAARTTAKRDLEELVRKRVLVRSGAGRGASYQVARKRPEDGPTGRREPGPENGP